MMGDFNGLVTDDWARDVCRRRIYARNLVTGMQMGQKRLCPAIDGISFINDDKFPLIDADSDKEDML